MRFLFSAIAIFSTALIAISGLAQNAAKPVDKISILVTLDGQHFTNAEVSSVTASTAIIFFDGGGKKIALTNLPMELQQKYHFDPVKAKLEEDQIAFKNQARRDAQLAIQEAQSEAQKERLYRWVNGKLVPVASFSEAYGKIVRVLKTGIILGPWQSKIGGFIAGGTVTRDSRIPSDRTVFVRCPVDGLADGQRWGAYCVQIGTKSLDGATYESYDTGLDYTSRADIPMREIPIKHH